ncbi:MAG: hypothetical protein WA285_17025, partial [Mycobacterium sp.]
MEEHDPHGGNDAKSCEGLDLSAAHNNLSVRSLVRQSPLLHHHKRRRWQAISALDRSRAVGPVWLEENAAALAQAGAVSIARRATANSPKRPFSARVGPSSVNAMPPLYVDLHVVSRRRSPEMKQQFYELVAANLAARCGLD